MRGAAAHVLIERGLVLPTGKHVWHAEDRGTGGNGL